MGQGLPEIATGAPRNGSTAERSWMGTAHEGPAGVDLITAWLSWLHFRLGGRAAEAYYELEVPTQIFELYFHLLFFFNL
jgi:hypothetical protein